MKKEYFKTNNGMIHYELYNDKKSEVIVLLHGWGQSLKTFDNIKKLLKEKYNVLLIDFIGFGESSIPINILSLDDYVLDLKKLLDYLKIINPIIIGHSFGGRVAIKYSSIYDYKKTFIVSSPAFKNRNFNYYKKIIVYKLKKMFLKIIDKNKYQRLITSSGSNDYKNAVGVMKEILKRVVREDLKPYLKKIHRDFIILGSVNDNVILYKEQLKIYKLVKNSHIYPFYKSGHFLYIEEEKKFINIIEREINNGYHN